MENKLGSTRLPVLIGENIVLRPYQQDDAQALVEAWKDIAIQLRNPVPQPVLSKALDWIAQTWVDAEAGTRACWAIIDKQSGQFAGLRSFFNIDWESGRAEAAAWVVQDFRGRGYAPQSMRLAGQYAFAHWPLARIQADCDIDNQASFRSLIKAGLTHEGIARAYSRNANGQGPHKNKHMFSLIASDFDEPQAVTDNRV